MARMPDYQQILRRLMSLANDGSELLTDHERDLVLGWPTRMKYRGGHEEILRLWVAVQERKTPSEPANAP